MRYLTRELIRAEEFISPSPHPSPLRGEGRERGGFSSGASVLFLGTVRNHSEGRGVFYLEYEAYEAMAERMITEVVKSAFEKWSLENIQLLHRLGCIGLGEIAVAIAVESSHRDEAYAASRYLIEGIKHKVPIWKKEYFADGTSEWSRCQSDVELSRSV